MMDHSNTSPLFHILTQKFTNALHAIYVHPMPIATTSPILAHLATTQVSCSKEIVLILALLAFSYYMILTVYHSVTKIVHQLCMVTLTPGLVKLATTLVLVVLIMLTNVLSLVLVTSFSINSNVYQVVHSELTNLVTPVNFLKKKFYLFENYNYFNI